MMKSLEMYSCKLVRDKTVPYLGSVKCDNDIVNAAKKLGLGQYADEHFTMFVLNVKGEVIAVHNISHGDLTSATAHPREIFKRALLNNAGCIALMHNHPSGDLTPSDDDIRATERLISCGELIGIPVIDHLIINTSNDWFSMKKEGLLEF